MKAKGFLFPFFLIVVTSILTIHNITLGEFWWADESRHAMDGVFWMDIIKDLSSFDLYRYTEIYFAKYPALGLTWYPPGFALIEAVFFGIFGISEIIARLSIVFLTLLSIIFLYNLIKKNYNELVAFLTCLVFITTPIVVKWAKSVMLELPAIALVILSCYFFFNYFVLNKKGHIYYLTLALICALYIKQTTGFIFPLFFSFLLIQKQYKRLFNRHVLICAILFTVMIIPLIIWTLKFGGVGLTAIAKDTHQLQGSIPRMSIQHWIATIEILGGVLIWPVWILVFLSILITIFDTIKNRGYNNKILFFVLWIIWWYIAFSYVSADDGDTRRYTTYVLPAIALLAVYPIVIIENYLIRRIIITLIIIICGYQGFLSYNQIKYYVSGYKEAAQYVMEHYDGNTILFGGYYDGNFIFNVRRYDKHKQAIVLRDSKILANWSVFPEWGYHQYANTEKDIYKILDKYGTKYIVVEDRDIYNIVPFQVLRKVLKKDDFTLEKSIKIVSNIKKFKDMSLLIYRYKKEIKGAPEDLIIEFPLLKRTINVPLSHSEGTK